MQKLETKEQECEELKTMVAEAEEAPICFHCGEENCIKQERDKYKKLSIDFKDVNKQLGYKYLTLKEKLKQTEQENKRLLEIINAKPLETVDIDSAFEIEKLKEQLQAKEQECEELKKCLLQVQNASISLNKQLDKLKEKNEKISKGYAELTDIVSPYIDDFTGYNEKLGGFDIILCIKELLQQLDQAKADKDELEKELRQKKRTILMNNDHYFEVGQTNKKLKQTLQEIKAICNNNDDLQCNFNLVDCDKYKLGKHNLANKILQKIKECEVEE